MLGSDWVCGFDLRWRKVVRFEFLMILESQPTEHEDNKNGRRERAEPRGKSVVLVAMGNCGRRGYCCVFESDTRRDRGYGIAPEGRKLEPSKQGESPRKSFAGPICRAVTFFNFFNRIPNLEGRRGARSGGRLGGAA